MTMVARIEFHSDGVSLDGRKIASTEPHFVALMEELLGPEEKRTVAGVKGSGRSAHWLNSGVVLVTQDADCSLVSMYVCLDSEDSSPYPQTMARVPAFDGELVICGQRLRGGATERDVAAIGNLSGFGGMPAVDDGSLHVGFDLRRRLTPTGNRAGERRLVQVVAEWQGVQLASKLRDGRS
jgi:hypothetical protein